MTGWHDRFDSLVDNGLDSSVGFADQCSSVEELLHVVTNPASLSALIVANRQMSTDGARLRDQLHSLRRSASRVDFLTRERFTVDVSRLGAFDANSCMSAIVTSGKFRGVVDIEDVRRIAEECEISVDGLIERLVASDARQFSSLIVDAEADATKAKCLALVAQHDVLVFPNDALETEFQRLKDSDSQLKAIDGLRKLGAILQRQQLTGDAFGAAFSLPVEGRAALVLETLYKRLEVLLSQRAEPSHVAEAFTELCVDFESVANVLGCESLCGGFLLRSIQRMLSHEKNARDDPAACNASDACGDPDAMDLGSEGSNPTSRRPSVDGSAEASRGSSAALPLDGTSGARLEIARALLSKRLASNHRTLQRTLSSSASAAANTRSVASQVVGLHRLLYHPNLGASISTSLPEPTGEYVRRKVLKSILDNSAANEESSVSILGGDSSSTLHENQSKSELECDVSVKKRRVEPATTDLPSPPSQLLKSSRILKSCPILSWARTLVAIGADDAVDVKAFVDSADSVPGEGSGLAGAVQKPKTVSYSKILSVLVSRSGLDAALAFCSDMNLPQVNAIYPAVLVSIFPQDSELRHGESSRGNLDCVGAQRSPLLAQRSPLLETALRLISTFGSDASFASRLFQKISKSLQERVLPVNSLSLRNVLEALVVQCPQLQSDAQFFQVLALTRFFGVLEESYGIPWPGVSNFTGAKILATKSLFDLLAPRDGVRGQDAKAESVTYGYESSRSGSAPPCPHLPLVELLESLGMAIVFLETCLDLLPIGYSYPIPLLLNAIVQICSSTAPERRSRVIALATSKFATLLNGACKCSMAKTLVKQLGVKELVPEYLRQQILLKRSGENGDMDKLVTGSTSLALNDLLITALNDEDLFKSTCAILNIKTGSMKRDLLLWSIGKFSNSGNSKSDSGLGKSSTGHRKISFENTLFDLCGIEANGTYSPWMKDSVDIVNSMLRSGDYTPDSILTWSLNKVLVVPEASNTASHRMDLASRFRLGMVLIASFSCTIIRLVYDKPLKNLWEILTYIGYSALSGSTELSASADVLEKCAEINFGKAYASEFIQAMMMDSGATRINLSHSSEVSARAKQGSVPSAGQNRSNNNMSQENVSALNQ